MPYFIVGQKTAPSPGPTLQHTTFYIYLKLKPLENMSEAEQNQEIDEYADWGIAMPLVEDDGDAGFRIKNKPGGETHRVILTGYDRPNSTAVRGRLFHVVHGTMGNGNSDPATLIVFEWLLVPGRLGRRFREVTIDVTFTAHGRRPGMGLDEDLSNYAPGVKTVAPDVPIKSFFSGRDVNKENSKKGALNIGYAPYVSFSPELSSTSTESTERTDYRFIAGYPAYVDKGNWGEPNSVHWTFQENAPQESGTPHIVRTAVLLQRHAGDNGIFIAKFKTIANVSAWHDAVESLRKVVGAVPNDDPVYFDPTPVAGIEHGAAVLYGDRNVVNQKSPCNKDNLSQEELGKFLIEDDDAKWRVTKGPSGKETKEGDDKGNDSKTTEK